MCFADINECWNDCACTGDEICENVQGSYICRPPTPGIYIIDIYNSVLRSQKVQEIYLEILCL